MQEAAAHGNVIRNFRKQRQLQDPQEIRFKILGMLHTFCQQQRKDRNRTGFNTLQNKGDGCKFHCLTGRINHLQDLLGINICNPEHAILNHSSASHTGS